MLGAPPKVLTTFRSRFPVAVEKSGGSTASCYLATFSMPKVAQFLGAEGKERTNRENVPSHTQLP